MRIENGMEFDNGCTITVPDNVTVMFASNAEGSERLEGVMKGDLCTAGNLTLYMVDKIYNNLDDEQRAQFIRGFTEIIRKKLPKNLQFTSVTIRKGVSPEEEEDE